MISKMAAPGTRQKLLFLINDIENISKELFEILALPKAQRADSPDTNHLIDLLVNKDEEVQKCLQIAKEQAEIQKKTDALKAEIDKRDGDIRQLQKNLKDAEAILATAIYQAKQKLQSIKQAENKAIPSEELIKYAHKISACNAVAAPPTWVPGDPRRPYPTDIEMRMGFLGRLNDNQLLLSSYPEQVQQASGRHRQLDHGGVASAQPTSSISSWQHQTQQHDHHLTSNLTHGGHAMTSSSLDVRTQNKENEDVEVMSTDSSSSSSSDE